MEIEKLLKSECVEICDSQKNKNSVLKKITLLAKQNPLLNQVSETELFNALQEREKMGSTAISPRIAIPHCRLKDINDFVLGILVVKNGVKFDSIDKKKTFVFAFIIAPSQKQNEHVRLLSYISQYLRKPENIDKLLTTKNADSIRQSIIRHTNISKDMETSDAHKLVTVIVQNEDKFSDLLHVMTEYKDTDLAVIEGSNAGRYLYHMPLFSSFMQTDRNDFCRIISAVVRTADLKDLVEKLTDFVKEKGVLYFIQGIELMKGKLEI
ncbi:MAG: PTS sugar transporter subunit IIA [Candidatus Cloacimonetes bacterium]|nr:PTS sugar transporter subunit IIA [Candidatus Cloacimonadota bacterium]MCF7813344.1 PTS sugar transporter subunit IIA [Candidatus Cloacimonadota bacterium]MCF7867833.1 PTS sugar transporter subunit IIA [Candidatus Cloacimonadota bacterium]MCF7883281.1 PTS sugar transporter subunit IIA [Candidatus Cloacimonadota bacterium]